MHVQYWTETLTERNQIYKISFTRWPRILPSIFSKCLFYHPQTRIRQWMSEPSFASCSDGQNRLLSIGSLKDYKSVVSLGCHVVQSNLYFPLDAFVTLFPCSWGCYLSLLSRSFINWPDILESNLRHFGDQTCCFSGTSSSCWTTRLWTWNQVELRPPPWEHKMCQLTKHKERALKVKNKHVRKGATTEKVARREVHVTES